MPDYSKSKIYIIRSYQTDNVYIGSTTLSLVARIGEHRRQYRFYIEGNGKGKNPHTKSVEILKYNDAYIELIENFPCLNKEELTTREYQIIRENDNCVNKLKGIYTTKKNWIEQNQEHVKQYSKNYEENRKEKRKEKIQCECGSISSLQNITTHRKTGKHLNFISKVLEHSKLNEQEQPIQVEQPIH